MNEIINKRDDVLIEVATCFNEHGIRWAIGGSLVLLREGLSHVARDIDLLVDERDISIAVALLDGMAKRQVVVDSGNSKSTFFYKFLSSGVGIDLMAGYNIYHDQGIYSFPFDEMTITLKDNIKGVVLYYTSLEDWLIAYWLMVGRQEKAQRILKHLKESGVKQSQLLRRALLQPLPQELRECIIDLLDSSIR